MSISLLPGETYNQAYYRVHRNEIKARSKRWRENHRDRYNEVTRSRRKTPKIRRKRTLEAREYRESHGDRVRSNAVKRYHKDPEKYRAARKKYYWRNRDKELAALKRYGQKNREKITARKKQREKEDIQFAIGERLRRALLKAVLRRNTCKAKSTFSMLGCSLGDFCKHLESNFLPGMSWANRPEWQIHHIVPLARFDVTDAEEQSWSFYWRNLIPLWSRENRELQDRLPNTMPSWLPAHIAARILSRTQRRSSLATGAPSPHP